MGRKAFEQLDVSVEADVQAYADENGYFYIDQCSNEYNTEAHYKTTGPEIWEDTDGKVDIVVLLAGTGGTISGLSKYFKEKDEIDIDDANIGEDIDITDIH